MLESLRARIKTLVCVCAYKMNFSILLNVKITNCALDYDKIAVAIDLSGSVEF